MITQNVEWEKVNVADKGRGRTRRNTVWIEKVGNKSTCYSRFKISGDLADELGWPAGTRVNLYRGGGMFKLVKSNVGLITLKKQSRLLYYNGWSMCAELHPDVNGTEFDGWVKGGELYFSPRK